MTYAMIAHEDNTKFCNCPACGYACSIKKVVRSRSLFGYWFDTCSYKRDHLHWTCYKCGAKFATPVRGPKGVDAEIV